MPQVKQRRFFWSENASLPVAFAGTIIRFKLLKKQIDGRWSGYYVADTHEEAAALQASSLKPGSQVTEITASELNDKTGQQHTTWTVEEFSVEIQSPSSSGTTQPCKREARIIHCVERHKKSDPEIKRRVDFAVQSWITLYETGEVIPCHVWNLSRSSLALGDKRDLPYLKDVLAAGIVKSRNSEDIIMFTNDDNILSPDLGTALFEFMEKVPACCSGRTNYKYGSVPHFTPSKNVSWGNDIGRDMFAFRKSWLVANFDEIPDFLLGELEWDLVLSTLIRIKTTKRKPTILDRLKRWAECELTPGYVWHEQHQQAWKNLALLESPAKRHNINLMVQWCRARKLERLITIE